MIRHAARRRWCLNLSMIVCRPVHKTQSDHIARVIKNSQQIGLDAHIRNKVHIQARLQIIHDALLSMFMLMTAHTQPDTQFGVAKLAFGFEHLYN